MGNEAGGRGAIILFFLILSILVLVFSLVHVTERENDEEVISLQQEAEIGNLTERMNMIDLRVFVTTPDLVCIKYCESSNTTFVSSNIVNISEPPETTPRPFIGCFCQEKNATDIFHFQITGD